MKLLKNEKGMALVLVLLIITVFSVVGLTVMAATINNAKQVSHSQDDIQTTDIAEMGVQHYQAQLLDFFTDQFNEKKIDYKTRMVNDFNSSTNKTITDTMIRNYQNSLAQDLVAAYKNEPSLYPTAIDRFLVYPPVDPATNRYYKIKIDLEPTSITTTSDNKECIKVVYHSYGYNQSQPEKRITATFSFIFYIDKNQLEVRTISNPAQEYKFENNKIPSKPANLALCPSDIENSGKGGRTSIDYLTCKSNYSPTNIQKPSQITNSTISFNFGVTFGQQMNKGIDHSTIYITGKNKNGDTIDTILPSHINGISNQTKILINGPTTLQAINQELSDSIIVIVGKATVGTDKKVKFKKVSNTQIYIQGDADLTNLDADLSDGSKICVTGTVTGGDEIANVYSSKSSDFIEQCKPEIITTSSGTGTQLNVDDKAITTENTTTAPTVVYEN